MPKATAGENALPPMDSLHPAALFSLAGKTALVTGGGSGIGAMIAAAFVVRARADDAGVQAAPGR